METSIDGKVPQQVRRPQGLFFTLSGQGVRQKGAGNPGWLLVIGVAQNRYDRTFRHEFVLPEE